MTQRVHNFNPGPAALPLAVLQQVQAELLDFQGTGMSILEHSHRGATYEALHAEASQRVRQLLAVPQDYSILWLQGGGCGQFALIALNWLSDGGRGDYILTGAWSEKALSEAQKVGQARALVSTRNADGRYTSVPAPSEIAVDASAAYLHLTSNNTIFGTQFEAFPSAGKVPLIADMSSDLLSRPLDIGQFGMVYAAAQKNLGPAGITLAIVRSDLLAACSQGIPSIFSYAEIAKADSLQNTIPTFGVYVSLLVLRWIEQQGGLAGMQRRNQEKADALYACIAAHADFFRCPVAASSRSQMNVVFRLPSEELEKRFLKEAEAHNLMGLKGHRSVGGIRASIYNAVEPSSVQALVAFMQEFVRSR